MKTRLQSLGLLDRSFRAATDDELDAMVDALGDDHRDALLELIPDSDAASVRNAVSAGRLDGTMESVAVLLTDACLADCIEQLGSNADHPSSEQLREVLPGLIERHGLACARMMLASAVAGEATAAAIIRELLKNDELVKLPPVEEREIVPLRQPGTDTDGDDEERQALKARRKEQRRRKQEEAQARRAQAERERRRK